MPIKAWGLVEILLHLRLLIILVNSLLKRHELANCAVNLGEARRHLAILASVASQMVILLFQGLNRATVLSALHSFLIGVHSHHSLVAILVYGGLTH